MVIELKAGRTDDRGRRQILRYIGSVKETIAEDRSGYEVRFDFTDVR